MEIMIKVNVNYLDIKFKLLIKYFTFNKDIFLKIII